MKAAIIGAGAAGYFSAIKLKEESPATEVTLYEASNKTLAKLIISGGGRCNVTTATRGARELTAFYPRGNRELIGPFSKFDSGDTVNWFESRGVQLITEEDGRMFPATHSSETVADCLREEARQAGVILKLNSRIEKIEKSTPESQFKLYIKKANKIELADAIIVTTGGTRGGFSLAAKLGHNIVEPVPSLFSFEIKHPLLKELQGVSFPRVALKLKCKNQEVFSEQGPILITHWGLSGPAIIKLSAKAARALASTAYNAELVVNFIPEFELNGCQSSLTQFRNQNPRKKISKNCPFKLPLSFWENVVKEAKIVNDLSYSDFSNKRVLEVSRILTGFSLPVAGKGQYKEEFVTCGGVSLKEVNFQTMESKVCPGLFFAGEILDIDGLTGGYNFQSAWTTGWLAARGVGQCLATKVL